ncbi:DNA-binding PadR family transcriptional regulator [Actinoplanes octamycinicus]|uniref:DNA-binding PadR family transcriptional regulator n=1 Tax=Actinoplanes octamycinicus TaxID=135948 RepID=A0A7W7MBK6_9ACTN|nr:hypothetical protein [Actinoplanes octamycinicus]MBB4743910.1 DNA-binding PadR family transcriptional regulator [Actinoplanes octamycinicus]GIE58537.1 hypothetical protein Aoc01nite_39390 [Actinoplanes octamycinicus]
MTTRTTESGGGPPASVYGITRPGLADAEEAVRRLRGDTSRLWSQLLQRANLTGTEADRDSLDRLIAVMADTDPVLGLCAQALRIRAETYDKLSAAHAVIRSAE